VIVDGFRLGIDFGTSNTVAVLGWPDGAVRPVLFDGSPGLASAVCVQPDGTLLVGRDAVHTARMNPAAFEPHPKRLVDDGTVLLGDVELPVTDVIAAVLRRVADETRRVAGGLPAAVTMTCPAAWGPRRREVLATAAGAAGLGTPEFIAEPVAAARHLTTLAGGAVPVGGHVVVYDFGAGTFDASVVRRTDDGFEILAAEGLSDTGGLDIDAAIMALLGATYADRDPAAWGRLTEPRDPDDRRAARTLWDDVRAAKEMLSRTAATVVHVPLLDVDVPLGRVQFDHLVRPVIERTIAATRAGIRAAGLANTDIDGVFLVGGSSRIPLAATLLHRALGVAPTVLEQPELVVAQGSLTGATPRPPAPAAALPVAPAPLPAPPAEPAPAASAPLPAPPAEPAAGASDAAAPDAAAASAGQTERGDDGPPSPPGRPSRRRLVGVAVALAVVLAVIATSLTFRGGGGAAPRGDASRPPATPTSVSSSARPISLPAVFRYPDTVTEVAFSPDRATFAVASLPNTIQLIDVVTGVVKRTLTDRTEGTAAAVFSPDGKLLATAGRSGGVHVWDVATGEITATLTGEHSDVAAVAFSPDGRTLAAADDYKVRLWNLESRTVTRVFTGHTPESVGFTAVQSLAFSPNGDTLAALCNDRTLWLWNVATGATRAEITGPYINFVRFSRDGSTIATGHESNHTLLLLTVPSGRVSATLQLAGPAWSVDVSPDGRTLATGTKNNVVQVWNLATRANIATFTEHTDSVRSVAFNADGRLLASGGADKTAWLRPVPATS
jgi:Ethanolamine utilization protein EutJ (predicted chaperonin)